jgi:hypothetical protein
LTDALDLAPGRAKAETALDVAGAKATQQAAQGQVRRDNAELRSGAAAQAPAKAGAGADAGRNSSDAVMARMDDMASQQQKFALHQGLTEMANRMIEALAKAIKAIGKAVADLTN